MKRPKIEGTRVNGPYQVRNRWRLIVVERDGSQKALSFGSKLEAERAKCEITGGTSGQLLEDAVNEYLKQMRRKGCKEGSIRTAQFRLQSFFQIDPEVESGRTVAELTPRRCAELYGAQSTKAVDTHRNTLALAKTFGQWCVKQGWLAANPLAEVEPTGRRRRGKEQLRIDEARKYLALCEVRAREGDAGAVAAMMALLLGLRASEVVDRVVRDLDDDGKVLWIPSTKTDAGRRTLEVPESLRPHLKKLAEGKAPKAKLFPDANRHWVLYHVKRLCEEAEVPLVSAHSLRGLHATLAMEFGSTGRLVAAALGHTSFAVTTSRHYVAAGTTERVAARRVAGLVQPAAGSAELPASADQLAGENPVDRDPQRVIERDLSYTPTEDRA